MNTIILQLSDLFTEIRYIRNIKVLILENNHGEPSSKIEPTLDWWLISSNVRRSSYLLSRMMSVFPVRALSLLVLVVRSVPGLRQGLSLLPTEEENGELVMMELFPTKLTILSRHRHLLLGMPNSNVVLYNWTSVKRV